LLFGFVPAWQASAVPLAEATSAGGRGSTRRAGRLRAALVVGEVAAAVLLLTGAGLLVRTLIAMNGVDPGFRAEKVLTVQVGLPLSRYESPEKLLSFYQAAEREVSGLAGVRRASFGGSLPLDGWDIGQGFSIVGDPPLEQSRSHSAHYQIVGTGYFRTLGIDLVRGRPFDARDTARAPQVCVVNEEFVRQYLSDRNPIGMRLDVQSMDMKAGPTPVTRMPAPRSHDSTEATEAAVGAKRARHWAGVRK